MNSRDSGRDQTLSHQTASKNNPSAWLLAVRPKTLPAAISPVLVGTAMAWAEGYFSLFPALAAAAGALLLQIFSNFANDYFDFAKGADTSERLGPTRVMAAGLLSPRAMRRGMVLVVALAVLDGVYLVLVGGWPILAVGLASLVAAVLYTGGPFPYGYHGLGDLFVFVFFGLVAVAGTFFVQAGTLAVEVLIVAAAVGALVTAILVVNNLRDIATDARAGKRTLAVLIGARNTRLQYVVLLVLAYAAPFVLWLGFERGAAILLPLLSLPLAVIRARSLYRATGTALNALLAATAQLSLIYSLLLSLALLL
ncbi:MAG: 1,4-dihydroxy-2-naphthoate polyprenyltransferase [Caldilineaceae bacterium]|nr:1,4-dihydroxy-2-naphthoate polyprenyltransferase [Caldilineaceae bacterium]